MKTLRIEWPSGAVQELSNVEPRQFLTVWEPPALRAAIQENGACELAITAEPIPRLYFNFEEDQ